MSLGGYKFKGYYIPTLPSADYRPLYIHRCRVKSFIEANTASGNHWSPAHSDGTYNEPTNTSLGNIIYSVHNDKALATVFKHDSNEVFYCIFTLVNDISNDCTSSVTSYLRSTTSSSYNTTARASICYHAISKSDFNLSEPLNSGLFLGNSSLKLVSVSGCSPSYTGDSAGMNTYFATGYSPSFVYWHSYKTASITAVSFGYAIKDKDILAFSSVGSNNWDWHISIASVGAFSTLSVPGDKYNILQFPLRVSTSAEATKQASTTTTIDYSRLASTLTSDGNHTDTGLELRNYYKGMAVNYPTLASFTAGCLYMPFEAPCLKFTFGNTESSYLNPGFGKGITTKGVIKSELFCMNAYDGNTSDSVISEFSTVADGNLLCVRSMIVNSPNDYCNTDATIQKRVMWYCGWDASNPDITANGCIDEYSI